MMRQKIDKPELQGLFVTGTGTDAGKTVVSSLLCRSLARDAVPTLYFKPVQTGCRVRNGRLVSPDAAFVSTAVGRVGDLRCEAGALFRRPVSPALASRLEKKTVSKAKLRRSCEKYAEGRRFVVAEGAGGLAVPLDSRGSTMADLCLGFGLPIVVAGPAGLGALNHFLQTAHYAESKKLRIACLVLVCGKENASIIEKDNARILRGLLPGTDIILLPRVRGLDGEVSRRKALQKLSLRFSAKKIMGWSRG